jgi:hypothetical protein
LYIILSILQMTEPTNTETSNVMKPQKPVIQECAICVEPYNKRTRLIVKCPYCEFSACRSCCQTYMLGETTTRCMNPECAKEWTLHFLRNAFTSTFINTDLKTHREDVLFQQEVALLPATQPMVEREIERENIRKEIHQLNKEIAEMNVRVNRLWRQHHTVGEQHTNSIINGQSTRVEFVRNCPAVDCRGFLSTQWKCGICAKWTCPTCHELKGEDRNVEHTCNPSNVATAELLSQDTRHCPKCATPIFKIDGCDQMWCTQCQTGFSWRTGRIETNVHNPHYFEWLRRTRGQHTPGAEYQCGRELTHRMAVELERLLYSKTTQPVVEHPNTRSARNSYIEFMSQLEFYRHPNAQPTLEKVTVIIRSIIHVNMVERAKYNTNHLLDNQDLRILYLRNFISKERFRTTIQQRQKKTHKYNEIRNVIDVVVNTVTDILFRFREYLTNSPQTECNIEMLDEIDKIREYANECLSDISNTYNSVLLQFNDIMRLVSVGANS